MKPTISASVGANAVNHKSDVVTVQSLLNRVPVEKGGPSTALKVDGLCYGKSLAAIGHFQKIGCGFKWPDQRVDPNGRTWNNLVSYAEGQNSNLKAAVLIHEGAHFVDSQCGHVASERPAPNGTPITDASGKVTNPAGKNYAQMDFNLAIRNAYSFAQCAAHCGLGQDKRPL